MVLTIPPSPLPLLLPAWLRPRTELRIDVDRPKPTRDDALNAIYDRLRNPDERLHDTPSMASNHPDLVIRYREADGEYYVYVEDVRHGRLAGYTVFNRLIEVGRTADKFIRAPHSNYAEAYQRRGLASGIYQWALKAGLCLMTGARQSPGAHALWHALGRKYELGCVRVCDKSLTYLGREVPPATMEELHTRMLLLGHGWTLERFANATNMG